jgi:hypothetical protein
VEEHRHVSRRQLVQDVDIQAGDALGRALPARWLPPARAAARQPDLGDRRPDPLGDPPYDRSEVKDRVAHLRAALDPQDQALLFLRVDQKLPWNDVAAVLAAEGEPVEVAALRKRFERAKARLRELAVRDGPIE